MHKELQTLVLLIYTAILCGQVDITKKMGAGNFSNGRVSQREIDQMNVLGQLGEGMARFNIYPRKYWQNGTVNNTVLDSIMALAFEAGVEPMILFEQYGTPAGDYAKWKSIGSAFAARYAPGGSWAAERNIENWGVTLYSAFNEPDAMRRDSNALTYSEYATALEGLADGVHEIDSNLRVIPGGFMSANAFSDYTLGGYGVAIAPLLNNGKLDGIDLHTYFGKYAPVSKYRFSAQQNFMAVKRACGVQREIHFYASEFNYKAHQEPVIEDTAAKHLFTMIWDNLGVCGSDSHTVRSQMALIWGHFDTAYSTGIARNLNPWTPKSRGKTWEMTLNLIRNCDFTYADPLDEGIYLLEGTEKKIWVWQNRPQWSSRYGQDFLLQEIPAGSDWIYHYTWAGLQDSFEVPGSELLLPSLSKGETHLFLAKKGKGTGIGKISAADLMHCRSRSGELRCSLAPEAAGGQVSVFDMCGRLLWRVNTAPSLRIPLYPRRQLLLLYFEKQGKTSVIKLLH